MINRNTSRRPDHSPATADAIKSIFPTFNVNVPMPRDTAVPGSYNKPPQHSSDAEAPKPAKPVR